MRENTLTGSILNIFLPPVCPLCEADVRAASSPFCGACHGEICSMLVKSPLCTVCGSTFASGASKGHACGKCLAGPAHFAWARSVFTYDGAVKEAIHRFKYSGQAILGPPLGRMLRHIPEPFPKAPDVMMPVPLHGRRLRQRGFNQSLLLAREASGIFGVPLNYTNLRRTRFTEQQANLSAEERKRNVAGAFVLESPGDVRGRRVALIDDVYTTGATIKECAKILKKAGAEVYSLTLARAEQM